MKANTKFEQIVSKYSERFDRSTGRPISVEADLRRDLEDLNIESRKIVQGILIALIVAVICWTGGYLAGSLYTATKMATKSNIVQSDSPVIEADSIALQIEGMNIDTVYFFYLDK